VRLLSSVSFILTRNTFIRAYVVAANPDSVKTDAEKHAFSEGIKKWIQGKVARHKFLRGGVVVIDVIPKRFVQSPPTIWIATDHCSSISAAGKILRRELRDRAKLELAGRDPSVDNVKSKL